MEKELKRYLKRKIRISLAVVVSFLITGSVSLSSIVSSNDILIENDKLILGKLSEKMSENIPIYGENIPIDERGNGILEKSLVNTEINNSGIIKGNLDVKYFRDTSLGNLFVTMGWGNGIVLYAPDDLKLDLDILVKNSGMISGNFTTKELGSDHFYSGNGILKDYHMRANANNINKKLNVYNDGIILGNYSVNRVVAEGLKRFYVVFGSGNGNGVMSVFEGSIDKIENNGVIGGKIYTPLFDYSYFDGNGIAVMNLKKVDNFGKITGESILVNSKENFDEEYYKNYYIGVHGAEHGNGIVTRELYNFNLNNSGVISGKSQAENVYSDKLILNLIFAPLYDGTGNGIFFSDREERDRRGTETGIPIEISSNGVISGNAKYDALTDEINRTSHYYGNGNGIAYLAFLTTSSTTNHNYSTEMSIKNSGMIKGYYKGDRIFNTHDINGWEIKFTESRFAKHDGSGINYMSELIENRLDITNSGLISGNSDKKEDEKNTYKGFGNGITLFPTLSAYNSYNYWGGYDIKADFNIENSGVVLGKDSAIYLDRANVNNSGIENKDVTLDIKNYGILAGKNLVYVNKTQDTNKENKNELTDEEIKKYIGQGLGVKLDDNTNATEVVVGTGGTITDEGSLKGYEIKNVLTQEEASKKEFDKTLLSSTLDKTDKLIINGVNKGLEVDKDLELSNSILNSYGVALTVDSNSNFTGKGTIINGGGLRGDSEDTTKKYIAVEGKENSALNFNEKVLINGDIAFTETTTDSNNSVVVSDSSLNGNLYGSNGNIEVEINNNSILNGNIDLSNSKESTLKIKDNIIINGDLIGSKSSDKDKLIFEGATGINIFNKISDFSNIELAQNSDVILYETAEVTGTGEIKITEGNQLNLRVDGSKKDESGKITGHALNDFNGTITGTTSLKPGDSIEETGTPIDKDKIGVFNIVTNGLGVDSVIDFSGTKFDEENVWVKTESILDSAEIDKENETVVIKGEKDLYSIDIDTTVDEKLYIKLNDIYKGVYTSGDKNFDRLKEILYLNPNLTPEGNYTAVTDEQQMATLLAYLKQVYTETPYSFSAEASRKSMNVFGDIVKENNFKAKDGEIITYGGLTHNNGEGTDKYYGKNYHGFDIGSADTKVDSKMTGAYGQIEKGISDSTAVGLMLGGNNNKVDIATSDLKGNSAYLGGYVKHDKGAFRGIAGIGIQYSDWDSHRNTMSDSYKENYSDRGLNIYAEGKYTKELTEGLFLEPKVGVSYDYIKQESINESKDKALALEVDGKDFDTLSGNVGLDLRKEIVTEKGKHNLTAGVNYTRILSGADEDNLTGNFGGNSFDILVPQKTKDNVSVGIKYDIELETGVMLGAKVSYDVPFKVSQDNHTHKNEGSWRVGVGIGYRFNTLNDLNPMNIISSSKKDNSITLRTKSYFEFDKAELNNNSKKVIEKFSEEINRDNLKGKIKIEGYTDNVGKSSYNEKLSLERATKVAEELKKQVKNSDTEYEILGKGASNPIGNNETEVGRAKNRRVEIEFQEK